MATKRQYEFIRFLSVRRALLKYENAFFVASFAGPETTNGFVDTPEVLVFPSDSNGEISTYIEVDGGRNYNSLAEWLREAFYGRSVSLPD